MKFIKKILLLTSLLVFSSCEDLILADEPANDPRTNFEFLWQEAKEKYSFFEYKNVDWDAIYDEYSPQVEDNMGQVALFNLLFD